MVTDNNVNDVKPMADVGLHDKIISLMNNKQRGELLDIASGMGALSMKLHDLGYNVESWDLDEKNFKLHGIIPFVQRDLNKPFNNKKKFEYVCAIEIVEHLENPYKLIRDSYSLLKDEGELIITTPNIVSYRSRLTFLLFGRFNSFFPSDRINSGHINPIPFWELKDILLDNGFVIQSVSTNGVHLDVKPKYSLKSLFLKLVYIFGLLIVPFVRNWGFDEYSELKTGNILIIVAKKQR